MRVLLVSYFGLREALLLAANALERREHAVVDFALRGHLARLKNDHARVADDLLRLVERERIDAVLWWDYGLAAGEVLRAKHATPRVVHACFCWDDPHCWDTRSHLMPLRQQAYDVAFTCCEAARALYAHAHAAGRAYFLAPGFDEQAHRPVKDARYACDVAVCIQTLYGDLEFPRQIVSRRRILDTLAAAPDINFRVYGPDGLRALYPRCYAGFVRYQELHRVFANARITVSTHVVGDADGYMTERDVLILGSGGLMLTDPVRGIERRLVDGEHCVYMRRDYLAQIRALLLRPDVELQRIRDAARALAVRCFTYERWAETVAAGLDNARAALAADSPDES